MRCFFYHAKIVVKEYKTDEFIGCIRALLPEFRKEKGCLEYSFYRDIEKENTYSVVAEWQTRKAMKNTSRRSISKCSSAPPGYLVMHSK